MNLTINADDRNWLIIGHYGGHNTGDEAMLMGLLWGLQQIGVEKTLVVTTGSEAVLEMFQAKQIPPKIGIVVKAIFNCRGVILGGGSHFQDDYVGKRYWRHMRYMLRIVVISALARLAGKKVIWLSMGFGPFMRQLTSWLTRIGLRFCHAVTVRETASFNAVSAWVSRNQGKLTLAFDLAALLVSFAPSRPSKNDQPRDDQIIGISVVSVRNSKTGGEMVNKKFWDTIAAAVETFMQQHLGVKFRIFIIRGGRREDDFEISQRLYERLVSVFPSRVELVTYEPDPMRMFQEIAKCDAFIATRFHSGVLAYLAGCRLLFLIYHRKVKDLAIEIGLSSKMCLELNQKISETALLERLDLLWRGESMSQPAKPVEEAVQQAFLNMKVMEKHI